MGTGIRILYLKNPDYFWVDFIRFEKVEYRWIRLGETELFKLRPEPKNLIFTPK